MSKSFFHNASYNPNKATKRFEFDIRDADLAIVNGIRRVIHAEIPILGFMGEEDVSILIHKNNGPLHNEFMQHRIGMLPIHFTEEEIEGFVENEYVFTCDIKNADMSLLKVTTEHIKGTRNGVAFTEKELLRLFPIDEITKQRVLITRLRQNEELSFIATVVKSTAKVHSAFSPVSLCAFFFNETEEAKDVLNILDKERMYKKNSFGDPTDIHFTIETETSLTPKYLIAKALEILISKVNIVHSELDVVESTKVRVTANTTMNDTFDILVDDEDDTLGNLIQSVVYSHYIRANKQVLNNKYDMSYIGYYAPHPLEKNIVIRMTLKHANASIDEKDFIMAMKECCRLVDQQLREMLDDWIRFV